MEDLTSGPPLARGDTDAARRLSDAALLGRFADGDAMAARQLTDRLGPRCYSVALRMLGNRAEAEDITQEAMMRLWRIAPDWEAGHAQVSTWLYRVTLNLCRDLRRRKRPDPLEDGIDPADSTPSVVDRMQDAARQDALQSALDQLPERQRQAVVLRHIEELPNPQIAGIMEVSVEAVESLTARGKRALAAILAERREELGYENG
ncbi:RNA polymerase sigma factor [Ruegeria sp.]|uniref:RNA polymerase sigma factor n=1 Tax=Ruegeria sp. TaxID=1879320 RepID=UPI00231D2CB9|nr:RNA polymerase sigma factor [Ruegeria sp.]MDA7963048.1 RNA polymerase sigma factor [Ruegeria sp.]